MSTALETFQLFPRGSDGWGTALLRFGRVTTLVFGPNGAGKTPIVKAAEYCLGHPVELPPLVRARCNAVVLTLVGEEGRYRVERRLVDGVDVTVVEPSNATLKFSDERAFSEWMLTRLGISLRGLTDKSGAKTPPYLSVVGPAFLVDQDSGWLTTYVPFESHQFIRDQREEVVRWLLDIPAKHRPLDKTAFQEAKTVQASIQEQIAFKRRALEALQVDLGEDNAIGALERLTNRRVLLEAELAKSRSLIEGLSLSESVLDVRIREASQRRDELAAGYASAKRRRAQLVTAHDEVSAELGALEQNEVAADAFRTLCGNEACQFFRRPEESYGRRLLYLKDQLKDFESSTGQIERDLGAARQELASAEAALHLAMTDKKNALSAGGNGEILSAVEAVTRELADILIRLDRLARMGREREQLNALINKELRAADEVSDLRPTGGGRRDGSRLLDARQMLASRFKEWMLALRTPNLPTDVVFDEELRLVINDERFSSKSSHSGSTRTRIVLAYHAALVDTSLSMGGVHPRLLVLDAPRQHELSAADLRSFIERFYAMSKNNRFPVQLVFSATDREIIPPSCVDEIWEPAFMHEGEPRFLGPVPADDARSAG